MGEPAVGKSREAGYAPVVWSFGLRGALRIDCWCTRYEITGASNAGFWKLGNGLVEADSVRNSRRTPHQCVRHALSAPRSNPSRGQASLPGSVANAALAVALDRHRHERMGGMPSKTPRVRRPRRRSAQPAHGRIAEYRPQGRLLL